jgi:hypothetical protein
MGMNAAHMIRRFETGGFSREQATCLAETIVDKVESTIATKEFVELVGERGKADLIGRINEQTRWFGGIAIVQTVAIITGTVTLIKLLE